MRDEFYEIVSGWMLIDGLDDITDRIERAGEWTERNGPLLPDEEATIRMMIESQIARGLFGESGEDDEEEDDEPQEFPSLGRCCICERDAAVCINLIMLPKRSLEPGRGCWGCVQCGLPAEGAVAVLCDDCLAAHRDHGAEIRLACVGYVGENRRVPIEELTEPFEHDMSEHPEEVSG